jgi:hypothetical protein
MKTIFARATAINAAFTVKAVDTGDTLVAFTEADAKEMQAYYDKDAELTSGLASKMHVLASAYADAFKQQARPVLIDCDTAETARGLFNRIVPALAAAKLAVNEEQFEKSITFGSTKLGLPPLSSTQMAEHMAETIQVIEMIEALQQESEAVATKH